VLGVWCGRPKHRRAVAITLGAVAVEESELTEEERQLAHDRKDIRLP
jgi:hypothetical protein